MIFPDWAAASVETETVLPTSTLPVALTEKDADCSAAAVIVRSENSMQRTRSTE